MKNIFILVAVAFSVNVFAENSLKKVVQENPEDTKWEVLKKFYEASSVPAELSDFEFADESSDQKCRLAVPEEDFNKLRPIVIRKMEKIVVGKDGSPASQVKIDHGHELGLDPEKWDNTFDFIYMDEGEKDLVVNQTKNRKHRSSPYVLYLRKNGRFISFRVVNFTDRQNNGLLRGDNVIDSYGYCWRLVVKKEEAEVKPAPQPEPEERPDSRPPAEPEAKADDKPESKPSPDLEEPLVPDKIYPEGRPESRPSVEEDDFSQPRLEPRSEVKMEPKAKPKTKQKPKVKKEEVRSQPSFKPPPHKDDEEWGGDIEIIEWEW